MKHRSMYRIGVGFLFGTLVIGTSMGVGQAQPSREAAPADALLEMVTASVQLQEQTDTTWQTIESRALVRAGDTIQTDSEGSAVLVWFEDGTLVELGPNTHLTINTFQISAEQPEQYQIQFTLLQGRVINIVNKLRDTNSRYEIVTPSVQLAVRGTQFAVEVDANAMTTLVVHEGIVAAQQGDVSVDVPAGYYLQATPDSPLAAATPLSEASPTIQTMHGDIEDFANDLLPDASAPITPNVATNTTPIESNPVTPTTAPVTTVIENTTTAAGNIVGETTNTVVNTTQAIVDTTTQVTETVTTLVDTVPLVGETGLDVGNTVTEVTTTTTEAVTTTVEDVAATTTTTTEAVNTTVEATTTAVNQALNSLLGWP